MHNVTNYLKQYMKVPKLLKYNNELFITYEDNIYRIYDYIEGYDIDKSLEAYNAKSTEKRTQKKTIFEVVV